jgi:hypothetical protein
LRSCPATRASGSSAMLTPACISAINFSRSPANPPASSSCGLQRWHPHHWRPGGAPLAALTILGCCPHNRQTPLAQIRRQRGQQQHQIDRTRQRPHRRVPRSRVRLYRRLPGGLGLGELVPPSSRRQGLGVWRAPLRAESKKTSQEHRNDHRRLLSCRRAARETERPCPAPWRGKRQKKSRHGRCGVSMVQ